MRFQNVVAFDAVSGKTSANSDPIDLCHIFMVSAHVTISNVDVTGSVTVQVSNDLPSGAQEYPARTAPASWVDVSGASATLAGAGGVYDFLIPKMDVSYQWMRLAFTATNASATGTLTAKVASKGW